jgi:hypothetical protein
VEVTLANETDKVVLAYTLSSGQSGMTTFGHSLMPGDSQVEKFPFGNLERESGDKTITDLRLAAVYFADGTTDGEPENVLRLKNRMLGIQEQAEVALHGLRTASTSGEVDAEKLGKIINDIMASMRLPEDASDIASERAAGRAFITDKMARHVADLKANRSASPSEIRERLAAAIASVERVSGAHLTSKDGHK